MCAHIQYTHYTYAYIMYDMYVYVCLSLSLSLSSYIYIYTHMCIYIYIYIYIYVYIKQTMHTQHVEDHHRKKPHLVSRQWNSRVANTRRRP